MKPRNLEVEIELASFLLVNKRYLDMGGTTAEDFKFNFRSKVHHQLLEKAPYGIAVDPTDKKSVITMAAERPFGARKAILQFEYSLQVETHEIILQKMVMELSSKPGQPLVWVKSNGKLPASDKSFFLIEGKKHQERKDGLGRQIKGGYYSHRRRN